MPYTYDEYLAHQNRSAPTGPALGGTRQLGGGASPRGTAFGGYIYNPGMDNQDFIRANVRQDFTGPQGFASVFNPVSGATRALRSYSAFKKAKKSEAALRREWEADAAHGRGGASAAWANTVDPTSAVAQQAAQRARSRDYMSDDEFNQARRQEQQGKIRAGYETSIEDYFADPARAGWQQGIVQNRLQNDLANVQEDFDTELTGTGQQAAGRGLKGGSIDVENRGATARTRDTRAIEAASNADNTLADFGARDQQSRAQLLGLVNSGDIGSADALRSALSSIHSATASEGAQYAGQQRARQVDQFGRQQQSQAWGQGLNAVANTINQNPSYASWGTTRGGW